MLKGVIKIYIKVTIPGKKIINNFLNTCLNVFKLFLIIKTPAKNGKNKTTCSQIKQTIGLKKNTKQFIFLASYLHQAKKIVDKKNKNKIVSFLPKTSSSAMGYNKKIGVYRANTCTILNFSSFK